MKFNVCASIAFALIALASCDDNTDDIGSSLIDNMDHLEITTDTFQVESRSILADSVLSRNTVGYLGKVRDPETGAYITSDFMTQFHVNDDYTLPDIDSIRSIKDGLVVADSCDISLYYGGFYGDSLATMKLNATEMSKPMSESDKYYSNFDPQQQGYLRNGGINLDKVYTLSDMNSENSSDDGSYMKSIRIGLNEEYTDAKGNKYDNYGTYIMRTYYAHPEYFKNSYTFINNVAPGFYIQAKSGLGSMAYINLSQLNVYFRYAYKSTTSEGNDTVIIGTGTAAFAGTEEVLQTTRISNDKATLERLANDNTCTYLKTPAGIFTELTLPVEEIMNNHASDTINTAKIVINRINNNIDSKYALEAPTTLLMIPKSEIYSFFEGNKVADSKTSFIATYSSTYNTYSFNNIANLVKYMHNNRIALGADWNKVVIVPVTTEYNSQEQLVKVSHDMSMTSTRLVGGAQNAYKPIEISIIYSKFK